MKPTLSLTTRALLSATLLAGAATATATPARAGIVINPNGIYLTQPTEAQSPRAGITGFRQFGRAGTFAAPGSTVPRIAGHGLGHAGRQAEAAPRRDTILSGARLLFGFN